METKVWLIIAGIALFICGFATAMIYCGTKAQQAGVCKSNDRGISISNPDSIEITDNIINGVSSKIN